MPPSFCAARGNPCGAPAFHEPAAGVPMSPDSTAPDQSRPRWWREPLLHFLLLGAALFALDHALVAREDDPLKIVVGPEVDADARRVFHAARGRDPDATELAALRQRWIDNEVLYREGLAMRVDRGDSAIRERVIFKSLSLVDAGVSLPAYDDDSLRRWFETQRSRYDEPARVDFDEAVVVGDASEAAIRAFVERLNDGAPGDAQAGLRVFKNRPVGSLVQAYGPDFADALAAAPTGRWVALPTRDGLRAIRPTGRSDAKPADYARLRGVVLQDWTDATMAEQRTAAVRAIAAKYRIVLAAEAAR